MTETVLTGLDGRNPLAFLAALGVLNATTLVARENATAPRLVWRLLGTYTPVLVDGPDQDTLLGILVEDARRLKGEPALELRYPKKGDGAMAHDLKPPPDVLVEHLRNLVRTESRLSLDYAAALATDVATDNGGNIKPTAFHFTAGQQEFLAMVTQLRDAVTRDDFQEALFGPWMYAKPLPVLQWDNTTARDYAYRASDPSKEKKLGVPGADWLAFRGLPFLRVAPVGDRIATTGCFGGWKTGSFRWPIWSVPLSRDVVSALLASAEIADLRPDVLAARGIAVVFEANIRRSDQGGYGSFTPARVASRRAPSNS